MHETPNDLNALQRLLDESYVAAGEHLLSIHTPDKRLSASQLVDRLVGVRVLTLATVSERGRPVSGPVDGLFIRGRFWFGTGATASRVEHIAQNAAVSATHVVGEAWAVTVHGRAERRSFSDHPVAAGAFRTTYGEQWETWAASAPYFEIVPRRMFAFGHE